MKVQSEIIVENWQESVLEDYPKEIPMSRASVTYRSAGDISGTLYVEYLMHATVYDEENPQNSESTYLGFIVFEGTIAGKSGRFVMEDIGVFANSIPTSKLNIKPKTGTNDFEGIEGSGRYHAVGEKLIFELEYSL